MPTAPQSHFLHAHAQLPGKWKNKERLIDAITSPKPILFCFWHSHSPESVEALHQLHHLEQQYGTAFPVSVVGIHAPEYEGVDELWEQLIEQFKVTTPIFHDAQYRLWEQYAVHHAPSYIVLAANGMEQVRKAGTLSDSGILDYLGIVG